LNDAAFAPLLTKYARTQVTAALRGELERLRSELERLGGSAAGGNLTVDALSARAIASHVGAGLERRARPQLRAVFNLTGTVLHTNLGRALLADTAVQSVARALTAPVNLEFDLNSGGRGDRDDLVEPLLCELTGAEAATVVNNNAAAVLLMLNTLANRREVLVSRGELVEIGGAFRIPDVMRSAGAKLVEVGTTNRTHASDYVNAMAAHTALLMKVHTSNYAVSGFTASVGVAELAAIGRARGVPVGVGARHGGGRRRPGCVQRRQAAGRAPGGHHRRPEGSDSTPEEKSPEARAARRQADPRRARARVGAVSGAGAARRSIDDFASVDPQRG